MLVLPASSVRLRLAHSEACGKEHELVFVLVGNVHLLAVLCKRGLDLLVRGEVNGGAAVLALEQWIGAEIKQLRYCARQPVGACHMQRRANCWAVGLVDVYPGVKQDVDQVVIA